MTLFVQRHIPSGLYRKTARKTPPRWLTVGSNGWLEYMTDDLQSAKTFVAPWSASPSSSKACENWEFIPVKLELTQ